MFRALKIFLIVLTIIFFSVGIYAKLINTDFEYFSAVDSGEVSQYVLTGNWILLLGFICCGAFVLLRRVKKREKE